MIPSTVMRFFTSASKMRSRRSRHSFDNCIQPSTDGRKQQETNDRPSTDYREVGQCNQDWKRLLRCGERKGNRRGTGRGNGKGAIDKARYVH